MPDVLRAGGDTWIAGSYDPDLDLTYWGIAQAKPWMPVSRGNKVSRRGALHRRRRWRCAPSDGTLAWHYQHAPGESLDLDEVFERVLVDIGPEQDALHDRQGRHPVEARSQDRQVPRLQADRLPERVREDRSRERARRPIAQDIIDQKIDEWLTVCPSTEGGHNWQAMTLSPADAGS